MESITDTSLFVEDNLSNHEPFDTLAWQHQVIRVPSPPHRKKGETPGKTLAKGYVQRGTAAAREITQVKREMRARNDFREETLSLKKWWKELKEDKPEKRYISPAERRAFPKRLGYPPKPKEQKHGPWAPRETKASRKYPEH